MIKFFNRFWLPLFDKSFTRRINASERKWMWKINGREEPMQKPYNFIRGFFTYFCYLFLSRSKDQLSVDIGIYK